MPEVYWICTASPGATSGSSGVWSPIRWKASVSSISSEELQVTLRDGLGSTAIFHAAKECGAQVRGLEPGRDSLEEIFARALGQEP